MPTAAWSIWGRSVSLQLFGEVYALVNHSSLILDSDKPAVAASEGVTVLTSVDPAGQCQSLRVRASPVPGDRVLGWAWQSGKEVKSLFSPVE